MNNITNFSTSESEKYYAAIYSFQDRLPERSFLSHANAGHGSLYWYGISTHGISTDSYVNADANERLSFQLRGL